MARYIREIMNAELFSVRGDTPIATVLSGILAMGVTGAPVIDGEGAVLGMVSLRDLVGKSEGETAADRMTEPAVVIGQHRLIAEGAKMLAETGLHRLVVVDADDHAVGVVSALDVVRGLIGAPAAHPPAFPHQDQIIGLSWTDDALLKMVNIEAAPDGPGILVLIQGGVGIPETIVWAESLENVQTRVIDLLSFPQREQPLLSHWLEHGNLRFRAARVESADERRRLLARLLDSLIRHGSN